MHVYKSCHLWWCWDIKRLTMTQHSMYLKCACMYTNIFIYIVMNTHIYSSVMAQAGLQTELPFLPTLPHLSSLASGRGIPIQNTLVKVLYAPNTHMQVVQPYSSPQATESNRFYHWFSCFLIMMKREINFCITLRQKSVPCLIHNRNFYLANVVSLCLVGSNQTQLWWLLHRLFAWIHGLCLRIILLVKFRV
jgi:hypothetical protein